MFVYAIKNRTRKRSDRAGQENEAHIMSVLHNPDEMHKMVCALVSKQGCEKSFRKEAGILYRVETIGDNVRVIIQSDYPLMEKKIEENGFVIEMLSNFEPDFKDGETVWLKTSLCPLRRRTDDNGHHYEHLISTREERLVYVKELLERNGFAPANIEEVARSCVTMQRKKENTSWLNSVSDYAVKGRITDSKLFLDAVKNGVGRYRSFGCGMLRFV